MLYCFLVTGYETPHAFTSGIPALKAILKNGLPADIAEDGAVLVPFLGQKVSAGLGQELADYEEIVG